LETARVPVDGGDHNYPGLLVWPLFLLWLASISPMPFVPLTVHIVVITATGLECGELD